MSTFTLIMASKDESYAMSDSYLSQQIEKHKLQSDNCFDFKVVRLSCNKAPITEIYNKQLNQYRSDSVLKAPDFLMFMHSDVSVDLEHMMQHLEQCKGKYDIIGLCGCSKISVSQSPLNWFCGSRPYPNDRWGCVTHGELGNATSYFSQHSPDVLDHEVACIDGLCIIFTRKALDSGICFDESFKFDQYDTDISFQAVMKYNLKLGVIVEKSLQHFSVGKSILTDEFLKYELYFRKKWNLEIPQGSNLEKLVTAQNIKRV